MKTAIKRIAELCVFVVILAQINTLMKGDTASISSTPASQTYTSPTMIYAPATQISTSDHQGADDNNYDTYQVTGTSSGNLKERAEMEAQRMLATGDTRAYQQALEKHRPLMSAMGFGY